jgi:hypothetical protein
VADAEQDVSRRQGLDEQALAPAFVAAEIALACGVSRAKASQLVTVTQALLVQVRHPRVAVLAHAGLLDWAKMHLLVTRLARLDPLVAECVEARLIPASDLAVAEGQIDVRSDQARPGGVLPSVTRSNVPQLRAEIEAGIAAIDPDGLADRARRARGDRYVTSRPEEDGMARIEARAGAEAVAAVMNDLEASAAAAGDPRTWAQISTDEFVHRLTHGRRGAPATTPGQWRLAATDRTEGDRPEWDLADWDQAESDDAEREKPLDNDAAVGAGGSGGGRRCPCGRTGGRGADLTVGLTMPLTTWLELASDPGQLAGYGPVAAALARQIAADAARDRPTTTTWQCVVTDDAHGTVIGIGRPVRTPRHDPPPRLAALVRTAHPTCVFPGCTVPARRCDLDYRVPYPVGSTCACNLQPACRTHHWLRTTGLISVRLVQPGEDPAAPPGTLEWTTCAGLTYRQAPALPVPPALAPALVRVPARLAEQRRADAAELRDLNARLRAGQARQHNRRFDDGAARDPLDSEETIERPPAAIDDNPAPAQPQRPLETWNDTYDRVEASPCSA